MYKPVSMWKGVLLEALGYIEYVRKRYYFSCIVYKWNATPNFSAVVGRCTKGCPKI